MKRCLVAHRSYRSGSSLRTLALWPTSSRVSRPAALVALAAFLVLLGNESAPAQPTTPAARQQVARAAVDMPVVLTQVPAGRPVGRPENSGQGRVPGRLPILIQRPGSSCSPPMAPLGFSRPTSTAPATRTFRLTVDESFLRARPPLEGTGISMRWTCKA